MPCPDIAPVIVLTFRFNGVAASKRLTRLLLRAGSLGGALGAVKSVRGVARMRGLFREIRS